MKLIVGLQELSKIGTVSQVAPERTLRFISFHRYSRRIISSEFLPPINIVPSRPKPFAKPQMAHFVLLQCSKLEPGPVEKGRRRRRLQVRFQIRVALTQPKLLLLPLLPTLARLAWFKSERSGKFAGDDPLTFERLAGLIYDRNPTDLDHPIRLLRHRG